MAREALVTRLGLQNFNKFDVCEHSQMNETINNVLAHL